MVTREDRYFMRLYELLVLALVVLFIYDSQFADRARVVEMPGANRIVEGGTFIDTYRRIRDDF